MAQLITWTLLLMVVFYTLPSSNGQVAGIMPQVCGPVCMNACPFGKVLDSQGCPTCECNPAPFTGPFTALPPPPTTECPPGSPPISHNRGCSSFSILPQRCPRGSFCVPDPADGPGVCCRRQVECRPVDRSIRCFRHWDQCDSDRDCWGRGRGDRRGRGDGGGRWGRWGRGSRCCRGPCGRQCQRPGPFQGGYGRRD